MYLNKLSLVNFKNYKQAEFELSPEVNCFVGMNGAGKTNLLDAVHYLSMCKSYLNPVDRQNINFDEKFFVLQGEWFKEQKKIDIYCAVKAGSKKVFKKNKVEYEKLAQHIGLFPSVMISPYDRNLISEGSELRRKWMDGIIAQFDRGFLDNLTKYVKVVEQRNAVLKQMGSFGFFNRESIDVWDDQLVRYGQMVYERRKDFISDFTPVFQKYYALISGSKEEVGFEYKSQLHDADFMELVRQAERNDLRKQYSTVGVHKDDLIFTINGHPIKKFGSQGQQKSYLTALRLAQFEWLKEQLNVVPILMLDDIFDKLDNERVQRLMELVHQHEFGQVLVTDTDKERVEQIFKAIEVPIRLFEIEKNELEEVNHE
ncbi:DNA replication/repair protein RecF [Lishizhenia sp.]|uniref:DNA replication/repair protein RecF n=1 Tax=Lishizhenia sp. TaxID=2497594 RepID=UPI00299E02E9|nr:DNA replication/repair protein RecF [Lishizhenia sp.]MDX1446449.1 DNA replication/repair protein RecF [Lishizhenia sp.]